MEHTIDWVSCRLRELAEKAVNAYDGSSSEFILDDYRNSISKRLNKISYHVIGKGYY